MNFRELVSGTEQTWEEKASASIKHSSHVRGDKRELALEPNRSGHDPGAQIQVASNSMFQCGNHLNRTKKKS